jgi:type VI secretion system protein ImpL
MASLQEVYVELNRMALSNTGALAAPGEGSALQRFQQEASRVQGPLQRWATQVGAGSSDITAEGTRAQLNARWQSQVLPFCQKAITDRYPFDPRSRADVAILDFAKLFAPNGLIDGFVNENLLRYIDTTTQPWSWKNVNNADLGLSTGILEQIQNAADIRDAFFSAGETPRISFEITPEALDPKAKQVVLEIDGQKVEYKHGDQITPVGISWPGSAGLGRVTFKPTATNAENSMMRDGPWAWFRLLNAAEVRRTKAPDQKRVIFNIGGRIAIFKMRSGSALNPFALPALGKFSCPASL